jgi:hypothetical protein
MSCSPPRSAPLPIIARSVIAALAVAAVVAAPREKAAVPLFAAQATVDAAKEKRLAWFREAKYGLFIHWGLYAIPAGQWNGKRSLGLGEWVMLRSTVPVKEYEQLAARRHEVHRDHVEASRRLRAVQVAGQPL